MRLFIKRCFYFALIAALSACSSIGYPNFTVADMTLPASEQAALKIQNDLFVDRMDDDTKKPWLMKGFPEISVPDLYVIPPGKHTFEAHLFILERSATLSSLPMTITEEFLPGHYYILTYTLDTEKKLAGLSISDQTDIQWWSENKDKFWAHYEEMRNNPNDPFVKVHRKR
jgi:hypothetical protein